MTDLLTMKNAGPAMTMSSREIAELCDKRHDHVMTDIRKMLAELNVHVPDFSGTYTTDRGNKYECFNLPKRETLILVSGYKLELRAKIIDRWQELEAKEFRDPMEALNDPSAMRGLLLTYTEKVIALEAKVAEDAPKVEALERISEADGSLCVTDAAKALQMRPKDLFQYLQSHGWIYKRTGNAHYLGYSSKVTSGLLEHKVTTVLRPDGSERITEQVRVTPKGLSKLAQLVKPAAA